MFLPNPQFSDVGSLKLAVGGNQGNWRCYTSRLPLLPRKPVVKHPPTHNWVTYRVCGAKCSMALYSQMHKCSMALYSQMHKCSMALYSQMRLVIFALSVHKLNSSPVISIKQVSPCERMFLPTSEWFTVSPSLPELLL